MQIITEHDWPLILPGTNENMPGSYSTQGWVNWGIYTSILIQYWLVAAP